MKKIKLLMLPLFCLLTLSGCNNKTNENSSIDNNESNVVISSQEINLLNTYRIGSRDFDTKTYLSWWIDQNAGKLCIYNVFDTNDQIKVFEIEYGKYTIVTRGVDYYKGYLYQYSDFFILEIGY